MKKILLILFILPDLLFAQENISRDQLVRYIAGQYVKIYIESDNKTGNADDLQDYKDNIQQLLNESINKADFNEIEEKLGEHWGDTKEKIWDKFIETRKGFTDPKELLDYNFLDEKIKIKISNNKKGLEQLEQKVNQIIPTNTDNHAEQSSARKESTINNDEINSINNTMSKTQDTVSTIETIGISILIAILTALAGLAYWIFKVSKELKEKLEEKTDNDYSSCNLGTSKIDSNEIEKLKKQLTDLNKKIDNLEKENKDLKNQKTSIATTQQVEGIENETQQVQDPQKNTLSKEPETLLEYFDNGLFKEGSDSKSFYVKRGDHNFYFIESKLKEALANNGFPSAICSSTGSKSNATHVKTIKPGKVEKQNGRWKVTEKIELKFE